jgi:hypothetical protein
MEGKDGKRVSSSSNELLSELDPSRCGNAPPVSRFGEVGGELQALRPFSCVNGLLLPPWAGDEHPLSEGEIAIALRNPSRRCSRGLSARSRDSTRSVLGDPGNDLVRGPSLGRVGIDGTMMPGALLWRSAVPNLLRVAAALPLAPLPSTCPPLTYSGATGGRQRAPLDGRGRLPADAGRINETGR